MKHTPTDTVPTGLPPVRLRVLADELETTPAKLEKRLGADAFTDAVGFKVVTAFKASQVLEEHAARKDEAARLARRNQERTEKYVAAQHAAIPKGFQKFDMATTTINPGGDDTPAVVKMTAGSDKTFEGGTYTRRPSKFDWLTGKGEGGAEIGPTREQMQKNAEANKANRAKNKKGG